MAYFNLTANEQSAVFNARDRVHVRLTGTFGTGTVTLQYEDDTPTTPAWVAFPGTSSWTSAADASVTLPGVGNYKCRLDLSGATAPDIDAYIR